MAVRSNPTLAIVAHVNTLTCLKVKISVQMMFGRTTTAHHTFFNLKLFKFYLIAITDKSHEESASAYKIRGVIIQNAMSYSKLCPKKNMEPRE